MRGVRKPLGLEVTGQGGGHLPGFQPNASRTWRPQELTGGAMEGAHHSLSELNPPFARPTGSARAQVGVEAPLPPTPASPCPGELRHGQSHRKGLLRGPQKHKTKQTQTQMEMSRPVGGRHGQSPLPGMIHSYELQEQGRQGPSGVRSRKIPIGHSPAPWADPSASHFSLLLLIPFRVWP